MLPKCRLCSAAVDCSTKSHIREIKLSGGRGLPSTQCVRGLPGLAPQEHARVSADNGCADFLLAVQPILAVRDRGAFREKQAIPFIGTTRSSVCSTSLEIGLTSNTRRVLSWPPRRFSFSVQGTADSAAADSFIFPQQRGSWVFSQLVKHWAADMGYAVRRVPRLPPVQAAGDWRLALELPNPTFRADAMGPARTQP